MCAQEAADVGGAIRREVHPDAVAHASSPLTLISIPVLKRSSAPSLAGTSSVLPVIAVVFEELHPKALVLAIQPLHHTCQVFMSANRRACLPWSAGKDSVLCDVSLGNEHGCGEDLAIDTTYE